MCSLLAAIHEKSEEQQVWQIRDIPQMLLSQKANKRQNLILNRIQRLDQARRKQKP
jgi:hypothetical protein